MNPKLNLLVRQNQGKRVFAEVRATLERLLGAGISRLSIADTDRLIALNKAGYQRASSGEASTIRRFISVNEGDSIGMFLHCFVASIADKSAYYTPKQSEYIGTLEISTSALPVSFRELLEFDGDSLQLTSKDEIEGLLLDWNEDEQLQHFELVVWGERWTHAAEGCLQ